VSRILILAGLALAALALSAPAAQDEKDKDKPKEKVYKTPQEVFDAFTAAEQKRDAKAMVSLMAPVAHREFTAGFGFIFAVTRNQLKEKKDKKSDEELKQSAPIFAVLDKHGLTEKAMKGVKFSEDAKEVQKHNKAVLDAVKDQKAFLVDLLNALNVVDPKKEDKSVDKLTELKVAGDKASGVVVTTYEDKKKKDKKSPVAFVKVGEGWKIIPELGGGQEEPAPKKEKKD